MIIKGDVNGDGKITVEDQLMIQAHILGYITLTGDALIAADTNNNGEITTADIFKIQKHLSGIEILNEVIE